MKTEDFIRELKNVEEQYKSKPIPTFEVNISSMARACRKHIEVLSEQIEKMKCCGNCKHEKEKLMFPTTDEAEHIICDDCENHNEWELEIK